MFKKLQPGYIPQNVDLRLLVLRFNNLSIHHGTNFLQCLLLAALIGSCAVVTASSAEENANRTLLGNRAVQKELRLTEKQQQQFDKLLAELEQRIADQITSAKKEIQDPDELADTTAEIENALISDCGNRLMAVLDKKQANRFWQIGEQAFPHLTFRNNRVQRVLKLSPEQLDKMDDNFVRFGDELRKMAVDPEVSRESLQLRNRRTQRACFEANRALLTDKQRMAFDELMGKPFDLELLERADGERPRSLTFVFTMTGRNGFVLLNSPKLQKTLKITDEQDQQIQKLLKQYDLDLTAIRLGTLKKLPKDFAGLEPDEKLRIAISILDETASVHDRTATAIAKILSKQQWEQLECEIVRSVDVRAIESPSIAKRVGFTNEQTAAFTKLRNRLHQQIAPLLVVRSLDKFDQTTYDKALSKFSEDVRSLLTAEQAAQLSEMTNDSQ